MKRGLSILALALLAGAGCSRGANKPADTALNTDLSLAQQQRGYQPIDSLSAAERGLAAPAVARDGVQHRATGSCIQRAQCGRRQHHGAGDEFCEQHRVLPSL